MTPKEERVWRLLITNRQMSDRIVADQTGTDIEFVRNLVKRIGSPNWRDEISVRDRHVGDSDYSKHKIQPWDIWLAYGLNPWDADIIKRVLRSKPGQRLLDYEKIKHVCDERIRQLQQEDQQHDRVEQKESTNT